MVNSITLYILVYRIKYILIAYIPIREGDTFSKVKGGAENDDIVTEQLKIEIYVWKNLWEESLSNRQFDLDFNDEFSLDTCTKYNCTKTLKELSCVIQFHTLRRKSIQ